MPPNRTRIGSGRVRTLQVTLTPEDRDWLESWVRSSRLPYGLHKRARAVLLAAAGMPIVEVARRVDMGRHHVYRWLKRYLAQGLEGLMDLPRAGRYPAQKKENTIGE